MVLSKPALGRFGIKRHPYTESCMDQFPCVCVYDYSSQTTGPICIKITLVDRTYHGDCYMLVRFELFTTSSLKFIQRPNNERYCSSVSNGNSNVLRHL